MLAAILGPEGTEITDWERAFFAEVRPLGFILFARNVENPAQLRRLTSQLREAAGHDALMLVDQEGGRVARLRRPHWREWLPPLEEVARGKARGADVARILELRYQIIGSECRAVGIDVNAVPCSDLVRDETHPFLRNRCLSDDVSEVIDLSKAIVRGSMAGGALPIVKHMPGHGLAQVDSHLDVPRVPHGPRILETQDFAVFRGLSTLPLGMTAHLIYEGLGETLPATQSPAMIARLRNDLGFDGLLMTDDIGMEALEGSIAERSAAAIAAGCDCILHSSGKPQELEQVAQEAGRLDGPALVRAEAALAVRPPSAAVDIAALEAEFEALTGAPIR